MMNVPEQIKSLNETNKYDKWCQRKCNCGKTTNFMNTKRITNFLKNFLIA